MKKIIYFVIAFLSCLTVVYGQGLGIGVGISYPLRNDFLKDINNLSDLGKEANWVINDVKNNKKNLGFNANLRLKLGNSPIRYCFNLGWNNFSVDEVSINVDGFEQNVNLHLVRNVYPLSAGLQFDILPFDVVDVYLTGDFSCNIIRNSIAQSYLEVSSHGATTTVYWPIIFGEQTTRWGGSVGVGAEFKLAVISLDLSSKVNFINLFKNESSEPTQSFIVTNLSILFGK